jgi:hypothetical protein
VAAFSVCPWCQAVLKAITPDIGHEKAHVRDGLPAQPVDATQALDLSAGVSNAKVLRGRSFS